MSEEKMFQQTCRECGDKFLWENNRKRRCEPCAKKIKNKQAKEANRKRRRWQCTDCGLWHRSAFDAEKRSTCEGGCEKHKHRKIWRCKVCGESHNAPAGEAPRSCCEGECEKMKADADKIMLIEASMGDDRMEPIHVVQNLFVLARHKKKPSSCRCKVCLAPIPDGVGRIESKGQIVCDEICAALTLSPEEAKKRPDEFTNISRYSGVLGGNNESQTISKYGGTYRNQWANNVGGSKRGSQ